MKQLELMLTGVFLSIIMLVGCNDDENSPKENKGRVNVHITDSPYPIQLIKSAFVTIDNVEIRQRLESNLADDEDSFIIISDAETEIDLLKLTNGITEQIASVDLDAGIYNQIRLHVVDATIVLTDGTGFDLKVPSGESSGLKIKFDPAIQITEGQVTDVLLDFDVSRSFVVRGKIGSKINGFNFKPVVRGSFLGLAGQVEGNVDDTTGNPLENAMVRLWIPEEESTNIIETDDETFEVSSFTGADGKFKLIGIPPGKYSLSCEIEGYTGDTIDNIIVTSGQATSMNFMLNEE